MRAVFTNPAGNPRLIFGETALPLPRADQARIKVTAFSLNQGETRTALDAANRYIPGWDFAGVVEKAAVDGSTPGEGTRVFGYVSGGAWAEHLCVFKTSMAEIPDTVGDTLAAALPIAGVTALACVDASGVVLDRRILITGASGGVGQLACQLAFLAGAKVFAISRRHGLLRQLQEKGFKLAGMFASIEEAAAAGKYDVIWESTGGANLSTALTALARNGICVNYGNSSRQPTSINVRATGWPFHGIQCIWLGREPLIDSTPALTRLVGLVKDGLLHPHIDAELPWTEVASAAERLVGREVDGKLVLKVV